jgi:DNA-binding beta-propeller fold protein YncE
MKIAVALVLLGAAGTVTPLALPGGEGGIGFDDLRFSPELHKLLVPAGASGRLDLVDPKTQAVVEISGFSTSPKRERGHSQGTTSADSGDGLIFASDRTAGTLAIVDPAAKRIIGSVKLAAAPDYVRWVAPLHEVWVSEPGAKTIEAFRLDRKGAPALARVGTVEVADGPESLEIDPVRRRAYTNTWHDATVAIDLASRTIVARWPNGCEGARGLALDAGRGLAFVGCKEGKAVVLDVEHGGTILGHASAGKGVDVIAFAPTLSHLYVPGAAAATLTVMGIDGRGRPDVLGSAEIAPDAHCVATDDSGSAYVCDPGNGRLLVFRDPYPATR